VNLVPIIDALQTGTFQFEPSTEALEDIAAHPTSSENKGTLEIELYFKLKSERNAIVAILLADVWNEPEFVAERAATIGAPRNDQPMNRMTEYMFFAALKRQVATLDVTNVGEKQVRNQILRKRLETIITIGIHSGYVRPGTETVEFIANGIGTASKIGWGLVNVIPELARAKGITLSTKEAVEVMERALHKIGMMLASIHQDVGAPLFRALVSDESGAYSPRPQETFNPSFFDLKKDEKTGKYALYILHEKMSTIPVYDKTLFGREAKGETTWCPARYRIDGQDDVITQYYAWIMDVVKARMTQT
jgi:hypothetical protein